MIKGHSWIAVGIFLSTFGFSNFTMAAEDSAAKMTGSGIELFERAHTFAGSILETPVFGTFEENPFGAKVEIRRNGKTLVLSLAQTQDRYAGDIVELQSSVDTEETKERVTHIEFMKIEKTGNAEGQMTLKIDGEPIQVKISGKSFDHGHFQSPHFESVLGGKKVEFDFTGEACFGYSANLGMMILGTYAHLSK